MNTQRRNHFLLALVACGACLAAALAAAGQATPAASGPPRSQSAASPSAATASAGEKVFTANCARCHMPPMSLSPRITGTVVAHMRVRARLSREDEKLLLQYLAP
jgi:cytochrome c5